jgi:hypothetical protein
LQVALGIFYPVRLGVLSELSVSDAPLLLGIAYLGRVIGLSLFVFGTGRLFVEACGFKHEVDQFALRTFCSRLATGRIAVPWIGVAQKNMSD